jgi:hypothetical protein
MTTIAQLQNRIAALEATVAQIVATQTNKVAPVVTPVINTDVMVNGGMEERIMMETLGKFAGGKIKHTSPGSITYLMYGAIPSIQSIRIKMGKVGENIVKDIITHSETQLELLKCGVQCIDDETGKNKDLDLLWKDNKNKIIYYREAKGNMELDTEKLPATIDKITEIDACLKAQYPDYKIDIGVFGWSVYERSDLTDGLSQINKCEARGIKVDHMGSMMKLLDFDWDKNSFQNFFKKIGEKLSQ